MNKKTMPGPVENGTKTFSKKTVLSGGRSWNLRQPRTQKFHGTVPQSEKSLQRATKSLASTYLAANLKSRRIPLKNFMDGFEKRILLACLRLTHSNQKDAAEILRIKPTALIEKMRKHGIRGRRKKLLGEPQALPQRETD
jgi:DNA-binding NtrC family response regulator